MEALNVVGELNVVRYSGASGRQNWVEVGSAELIQLSILSLPRDSLKVIYSQIRPRGSASFAFFFCASLGIYPSFPKAKKDGRFDYVSCPFHSEYGVSFRGMVNDQSLIEDNLLNGNR